MDALDLLEQQHRRLADLFAGVAAAEAPGRRTSLLVELVRAVEAHSRVEESVFYSAFSERVSGDDDRLYEAFEGHALLRFAAVNLLRTRATDVRLPARIKLVQHLFRRHTRIEEGWMFPKAKRALNDEALDRIGDEIARAHVARLSVSPAVIDRPRPRRRIERATQTERRAFA